MALNERSGSTIQVDCGCRGLNASCVNCRGTGQLSKRSCQRCGGTGRTGGTCVNCRGLGWRELDNPDPVQP